MRVQSLGYSTDLMLLRRQGSVVSEGDACLVVRTPANLEFHWGNYVLADQSWVDRPLADLVGIFGAEHPRARHLAIGVDGVDGRVWGTAELGACGLEVERSVVMTAAEVPAPLHANTGAVYRMLTTDADWAVAAELHSTADDSSGPVDPGGYEPSGPADPGGYEQRRMAARRAHQATGLGGWFGAFVAGKMLCGLGLFTDGSGIGRFQSVDTVASARRLGLASTLLHHASTIGRRDFGIRKLVIVADPEDTAIRLYRSLGFAGSEIQTQLARPTTQT